MGLKEQVIKEIIKECIQPLLELKKGFEKQENRIDDITDGLPTEKYPSVNAVINFVKNKITAFGESISTVYAKQNDFENLKTDVKGYIHSSEKGAKSGVATLDESGFVPAYQLPSYVDDILEFEGIENFPETGVSGLIYVDTLKNLTYRWSGSVYVEISPSLAIGTTQYTAAAGNHSHTFDDVLSAESENAVQNKVVKSELDNLKLELCEQKDNITATATGNAITIDSAKAPLQQLKLYGKTTQNGTPTPSAPVPLVSVGDSGSFEVGVYGRNLAEFNLYSVTNAYATVITNKSEICIPKNTILSITATFEASQRMQLYWFMDSGLFPNNIFLYIEQGTNTYTRTFTTTKDVKIAPNQRLLLTKDAGTVTALNCQLEIGTQATPYEPCNKQTLTMPYTLRSVGDSKDEVDFNRGVLIPRLKKNTFKGSEEWGYMAGYGFFCYIPDMKKQSLLLSNLYPANNTTTIKDKCVSTKFGSGDYIWLFDSDYNENVDSLKTSLASNPMTVIYELATPIETPLTETELNDYRHLMTNKGTTTVLSEADMELDYYINNPNAQAIGNLHEQITKDYFKLTGVLNVSESTEQGGEDVE